MCTVFTDTGALFILGVLYRLLNACCVSVNSCGSHNVESFLIKTQQTEQMSSSYRIHH